MTVGNEKASKEIICPGCGGVMKNTAFNPITDTCGAMLQDGWLCPECAYKLRPKYPMHYTEDDIVLEKAPDAGRPILTMIRNDFLYADPFDQTTALPFRTPARSGATLWQGSVRTKSKMSLRVSMRINRRFRRNSAVRRTCSKCSRSRRCQSSSRSVPVFPISNDLKAPLRWRVMYAWARLGPATP